MMPQLTQRWTPGRSLRRWLAPAPPTVFHVTHRKAGSQWIYAILRACAPERTVVPQKEIGHVLCEPIVKGRIYPAAYLRKAELDAVAPRGARRFVIIRDLRDTLVSDYFSAKISHPVLGSRTALARAALSALDEEDGLLWVIEHRLEKMAEIQESWCEAGEPVIRYEDLIVRDLEILQRVLLDHCGLDVTPQRLGHIVADHRFERLTGGRPRGQEDVTAHERKGIAGDWKNHFTPRVKEAFKHRFGQVLVAAGYESGYDW
jgi:lipopolysaccharide transport system ATP-binding protein